MKALVPPHSVADSQNELVRGVMAATADVQVAQVEVPEPDVVFTGVPLRRLATSTRVTFITSAPLSATVTVSRAVAAV